MSSETTAVAESAEPVDRPHGEESTPPSEAAPAGSRSRTRWLIVAAIVVGYLLHVAWRVWLARSVSTPIAHADEDRYLLSARVLAGGPGGLGNDTAAFRRMGYPIVLAPIYSFTDDPFRVYHAAQVIGAIINALTFPLGYLLGRRVLGVRPWLAVGLAFIAATLPAVVYYAQFTLTDVLFAPLGLAWLLLLHGWVTARSRVWRVVAAMGAGVVVGYAYAVHVRGLVMLGVHALVLAYVVVTGKSRWKVALASLATALVVTRVDALAQSLVGDRLIRGGVEPGSRLFDRLTDARGLVHILVDAVGQIWYAGVATWGLAAVGLIVAVARIRGRDVQPVDHAQRLVLGTAIVATVLIALSSSAALPPDGRVSNHAYFRYIAFLMPVFVILAMSALVAADRRRVWRLVRAAAAVLGVGAFFVLTQLTEFYRQWYHPFDTPEVAFLTYNFTNLPVARATVTALVMLVVLALTMSSRRRAVVAAALAAVLLTDVVAMEVVNAKSIRPMAKAQYEHAPRLVHDLGVSRSDVVATSKRVSLGARLNHQREVHWARVIEFDHLNTGPPAEATVVVAPWRSRNSDDWDGRQLGWERVATDPNQEWALWLRGSDPRIEAMRSAGFGG